MSVVQVFKCDTTGKLFEDKKKYVNHLRRIAASNREKAKVSLLADECEKEFIKFRSSIKNIDHLQTEIIEHQNLFWNDAMLRGRIDVGLDKQYKGKVIPLPKLILLEFINVSFNLKVSNSHSCPLSGVENWEGDKSKPTGYPGWHGRVRIVIEVPEKSCLSVSGSDLFSGRNCCIHTGTGGGGGQYKNMKNTSQYQYDVRIYGDDWPKMMQQVSLDMLKGRYCVC